MKNMNTREIVGETAQGKEENNIRADEEYDVPNA
jgi:hypothetical protein